MHSQVFVNPEAVSALVGIGIPLLVGLLTKCKASAALKGVLNALLSALTGGLTAWLAAPAGTLSWSHVIFGVFTTWVVSVATHYGLWKPTGVSDAVARLAPDAGVGKVIDTTSRPASSTP